jgi:uncharacterized membrane-anchored protein YhcB (DUF1043 family)
MKNFQYPIIGGFIGLIAGVFFGLVFDSFYTKKSQLETKQTIQPYIFGAIGAIVGISLGLKVAEEENKAKQKQLEEKRRIAAYKEEVRVNQIKYQNSLVETKCNFCDVNFKYSTLKFTDKKYCDSCISKIKNDYILKCKEINRIVLGIEQLKRHSAINARLDKVKEIAEGMAIYENVELDFISKKPSEFSKSADEYRLNLK